MAFNFSLAVDHTPSGAALDTVTLVARGLKRADAVRVRTLTYSCARGVCACPWVRVCVVGGSGM